MTKYTLPRQIQALSRVGYAHTLGEARKLIREYWIEQGLIKK